MSILQAFVHSIKLPSKHAIFRLNRLGMDHTVGYMFILLFLVSLPSLIDQLTATSGLGADMNIVFKLIYFFMFYYLPLTIFVFLLLCLIAYIGVWIARSLGRKLHFSILWKMSAYTTTIPFLLYAVVALLFPVSDVYLLLTSLFTFVMLVRIITVYPRRKKRG
ncbi:DUF1189 family protein [Lentibacillus sediminis]|uniref:DUF1189 family protein n=1 Tax=Lentibacillus sediminis TaxID=1940529 RepID=UPI000C1C49C6|nr:DUF1189 family protein [Lentibacillus sediminis]